MFGTQFKPFFTSKLFKNSINIDELRVVLNIKYHNQLQKSAMRRRRPCLGRILKDGLKGKSTLLIMDHNFVPDLFCFDFYFLSKKVTKLLMKIIINWPVVHTLTCLLNNRPTNLINFSGKKHLPTRLLGHLSLHFLFLRTEVNSRVLVTTAFPNFDTVFLIWKN